MSQWVSHLLKYMWRLGVMTFCPLWLICGGSKNSEIMTLRSVTCLLWLKFKLYHQNLKSCDHNAAFRVMCRIWKEKCYLAFRSCSEIYYYCSDNTDNRAVLRVSVIFDPCNQDDNVRPPIRCWLKNRNKFLDGFHEGWIQLTSENLWPFLLRQHVEFLVV